LISLMSTVLVFAIGDLAGFGVSAGVKITHGRGLSRLALAAPRAAPPAVRGWALAGPAAWQRANYAAPRCRALGWRARARRASGRWLGWCPALGTRDAVRTRRARRERRA